MCGGFALFFHFFHMRRRHRPFFVGHWRNDYRCRRPCWRRPARRALILRRATPTSSAFSRVADAHVGVALPAKPYSFVGPRQQGPPFPALPAPMLASPCPQSLNPSSGHANKLRLFPRCRRPCWRRPPGKAIFFRRATPTSPALSRAVGAHVGVTLPAKPLSSVGPRQQGPPFPALPAPMLASPCPQSLNPPSGHANKSARKPARRVNNPFIGKIYLKARAFMVE